MLTRNRFAIDRSADFSTANSHIQSLATASPDLRSRLSTTVSVKTQPPPVLDGDNVDKEKRKHSEGGAQGKKHKKVKGR